VSFLPFVCQKIRNYLLFEDEPLAAINSGVGTLPLLPSAGVAAGQQMFLLMTYSNAVAQPALTNPAWGTLIHLWSDSNNYNSRLYGRLATGVPANDGDMGLTWTGGNDLNWFCFAMNQNDPLAPAGYPQGAGGGSPVNDSPTSIIPTQSGQITKPAALNAVFSYAFCESGDAASNYTAPPAGFTQLAIFKRGSILVGGLNLIGMLSQKNSVGSVYQPGAFTNAGSLGVGTVMTSTIGVRLQ